MMKKGSSFLSEPNFEQKVKSVACRDSLEVSLECTKWKQDLGLGNSESSKDAVIFWQKFIVELISGLFSLDSKM